MFPSIGISSPHRCHRRHRIAPGRESPARAAPRVAPPFPVLQMDPRPPCSSLAPSQCPASGALQVKRVTDSPISVSQNISEYTMFIIHSPIHQNLHILSSAFFRRSSAAI